MSEFIKEVRGDLLAYDAKVRCHQVNCKGVMGAGLPCVTSLAVLCWAILSL